MRTIKVGLLKKVEIYEGIKEMPIEKYQEFQKLLIQDLGIGSDMESIGSHFSEFHKLLNIGDSFNAMQEAKNLHNNFFMMVQGISIKSHCLASLVHAVNGKPIPLDEAIEIINKIKVSELEEIIEDVKKKLTQSFNPIFLTDTGIQD